MRAGAISASLFGFNRQASTAGEGVLPGRKKPVASTTSLAAERFASEQIRGLVRQVFLAGSPVWQAVFTSTQSEIDVQDVCFKVGQSLAAEMAKEVLIVTRGEHSDPHHGEPVVVGTSRRRRGRSI